MPTDHNNHVRCQSCGVSLEGDIYGKNADGSKNEDYCKFCYENGAFTEPNLRMEEMLKSTVRQMILENHIEEEQAEVLANATIPSLKRWKV